MHFRVTYSEIVSYLINTSPTLRKEVKSNAKFADTDARAQMRRAATLVNSIRVSCISGVPRTIFRKLTTGRESRDVSASAARPAID